MLDLRLISLVCHGTEDWTGADETYLLAAGRRVWGPNSMNDNDVADLTGIPHQQFRSKIRIDLYDKDAGFVDDDDHLGRTYARASQAGKGEQEHDFTGDGAHYTLTYEVLV